MGGEPVVFNEEPMHEWFSLTYANYLVLPRTLIQSMPDEWQWRLRRCLEELDAAARDVPQASRYRVMAVGDGGRFIRDPLPHYDRGRARVPLHPIPREAST